MMPVAIQQQVEKEEEEEDQIGPDQTEMMEKCSTPVATLVFNIDDNAFRTTSMRLR